MYPSHASLPLKEIDAILHIDAVRLYTRVAFKVCRHGWASSDCAFGCANYAHMIDASWYAMENTH